MTAMIYAMGKRSVRRPKARGFSLIELLVVLVIMGIALGLTLGLSRYGLTGLHLKGSARDIVTTLRYARERSVAQQAMYKVVFQMSENRVYLTDEMNRSRRAMQLNPDVWFRHVRVEGLDIRNREMVAEIGFFPNGSSTNAEIILENKKGARIKIVTDLLTGAAKIVPLGPGD